MAATPVPVQAKPRTIVYIDGFNLYYGAIRDVPALKWLDIEKLGEAVLIISPPTGGQLRLFFNP